MNEENLLHDRDGVWHAIEGEGGEGHGVGYHTFRAVTELVVAGRPWALFLYTTPEFDAAGDSLLPRIVLGGGLLVSFLLFMIVRSVSTKQEAAQELAEDMTSSLRQSEAELREARDHLELRVNERTEQLSLTNRSLQGEVVRRTRAEMQLEHRLNDLNKVNGELNNFAYIVSHDLKAPLRAISSLAGWIAEDNEKSLDEEGRENLATLMNRTRRMDSLIDGILRYSRIGRLDPRLEDIDTGQVARDVIDSLAPPEDIAVRIEGELPLVRYDRTHMVQLFQNLVSNAITHMGKPCGEIVVFCDEYEEAWEFAVRDTGQGIDEKHFERIFKIFQSLKSRDEAEATGIGLSLVKAIAEKHGGRVRIESTVGQGSTFYFTISKRPVGSEASVSLETDADAEDPTPLAASWEGP